MYEVIGHEKVREELKNHKGSFILMGPEGVGRRGILDEWVKYSKAKMIPGLNLEAARAVAERAVNEPGLKVAAIADQVPDIVWGPLLSPIESGLLTIGVTATRPTPLGRSFLVRLLKVGYLSEAEILRILATQYPSYTPRPWIAKAAKGTLKDLDHLAAVVQVFEPINYSLENHKTPNQTLTSPRATFECIRLACAARLGAVNLPWTPAALSYLDHSMAQTFLALNTPGSIHDYRNLNQLFFGWIYG
jgi:hypothetical protein